MEQLWEILLPKYNQQGQPFAVEHHRAWDAHVRSIAGGITILRTAKGEWVDPDGKLQVEEMIPVRVHCTKEDIRSIAQFTLTHYEQEEVFAYLLSSTVIRVRKQT